MADATQSRKRKRTANGCVNAANDILVEELRKIRTRIRESSHLAASYGRAITSLQNHPDPITCARDAKQLKNIGNYIANQIQAILHKQQIAPNGSGTNPTSTNPTTRPTPTKTPAAPPTLGPKPRPTNAPTPTATRAPTNKPTNPTNAESSASRTREYAPARGKQPWYVLQALGNEKATSDDSAITTELLLRKMQAAGYDGNLTKLRACLASMASTYRVVLRTSAGGVFLSESGQRSLALCSTSTSDLLTPNTSGPSSPEGTSTAHEPASAHQLTSQSPDDLCIVLSDTDCSNLSEAETVRAVESDCNISDGEDEAPMSSPFSLGTSITDSMLFDLSRPSDEWEIVLVLDHREILSRRNRDILERKLLEHNVTCEVRALNVGDVQWVARRYRGTTTDEFMLNVIVERKEVRDLSGSIIDRRYNEQKARLRDSGMTHVIYLIEGSLTQQTTVRASGLQTAMCRTQLQNQFFVQLCQNADETVAFLRGVHRRLLLAMPPEIKCRNRERMAPSTTTSLHHFRRQFCAPLRSFSEFNAQFRKRADFTVSELYQMMLMQVAGLSSARTVALASKYPTFRHLTDAIERQEALQELRYGDSQRRFGAKTHEFLSYLLRAHDYEIDTPTHLTPQH